MDIYDLENGAVRYERCPPCGGTWYKLADDRWALVARGWKDKPPASAPAAVSWGTVQLVEDGPFTEHGRPTGNRRFAAAEILDDPRPHLLGHKRAEWQAAHPLAADLFPVVGPSLADVLRELDSAGIAPVLDAGELVIGAPSRAYRPLTPGLRERVIEYAALIEAHVAGKSVACAVAKCKEQAERMAWPARPLCATHSLAVVRAADVPEFTVELPAPSPEETARKKSNRAITGALVAELTERKRYSPPGALTKR